MQYREYGSTDLEVSTLGFGLMRLPTEGDDSSEIDEEEAVKMVRYAIDEGVNYLDTAYPYHGGNSETLAAKALKGGYREKVHLVTKLPVWEVEEHDDFDRLLNEQLEKLETDCIDVYLLHGLNSERWEKVSELQVEKFLDRIQEDGRVRYVGFSFHDELGVFKNIVDSYDWDACLIQLNFMDHDYQAGVEGMRYAQDNDMAVAIMEPLRGGKLAENVPDDVMEVWQQADVDRTPADWALRWVCNHPEVSVVLSGMSNMQQMKENIETVKDAYPNSLTDQEIEIIEEVRDIYLDRMQVNCTSCEYCLPCPQEVSIPRILSLWNEASMYQTKESAAKRYASMQEDDKSAVECVECGACEEECPQTIKIIDALKEAHQYLNV